MSINNTFPVQKLPIQKFLSEMNSVGIPDIVASGLKNEIKLVDQGEHISDIASIVQNPITKESETQLSAAFCQFFWFVTDIALKIIDRNVICDKCQSSDISLQDFSKAAKVITEMPLEILEYNLSNNRDIKPMQFKAYFESITEVLCDDFNDKIKQEFNLAMSLTDKSLTIDMNTINKYDLSSGYSQRVNSVICFGVVFILLHELSHHELGHVGNEDKEGDEHDADVNAYWSILTDIEGEERFSAIIGMLCVFLSFMMLDPKLTEDGIHPRDYKRLFDLYDNIKDENPQYTFLIIKYLEFWATINNIKNYPMNLVCESKSIDTIKEFLDNWVQGRV